MVIYFNDIVTRHLNNSETTATVQMDKRAARSYLGVVSSSSWVEDSEGSRQTQTSHRTGGVKAKY